jgi:hypothetical protein
MQNIVYRENNFGTGFGQSRSEVRIMHPYQSSEACPVRLFDEYLFSKWNLGISNGTKGLLFFTEPKMKDYASAFKKSLWFPKKPVLMGLWAGFFKNKNIKSQNGGKYA